MDKVVLSRAEWRIVALVVNLFMLECLSKCELISMLALMIEHMYKAIHVKERRCGMPYGYLINKVLNYFSVVSEKETPGTPKKMFTRNI